MIIFLAHIPANSRKQDIIAFIKPISRGGMLQKYGHIDYINILVLKDSDTNTLEYHGIIGIDSEVVAKRVLKKLNRKVFNGKHIAVREYYIRSWHNDPRINISKLNKELINRRNRDRRRSNLEKDAKISVKFSSQKKFHQVL